MRGETAVLTSGGSRRFEERSGSIRSKVLVLEVGARSTVLTREVGVRSKVLRREEEVSGVRCWCGR